MAIVNGYCTLTEYKAFVTQPGGTLSSDPLDDGVIENIIEAVSRYIDAETLRTFYARTTTTRLQSVQDDRLLYLDDDLLSIDASGLVNGDGTVIASTQYKLLPLNGTPKYAIRLNDSSPLYWTADSSGDTVGVISVTGSWGYSTTAPDDVRLACMIIVKGVYNRRFGDNQSSDSTITTGGVVITPRDIPLMAARTINKYRRQL